MLTIATGAAQDYERLVIRVPLPDEEAAWKQILGQLCPIPSSRRSTA